MQLCTFALDIYTAKRLALQSIRGCKGQTGV